MWEVGSHMWPSAGRCPLDYTMSYDLASIWVGGDL